MFLPLRAERNMALNQHHFNRAVKFGAELITTRDLDPVYVALIELPEQQRARTLLAYTALYHLGAAAYLGEHVKARFWDGLEAAADNAGLKWPRGSERRHWRGEAARRSARWLRDNFESPEQCVYRWYNAGNGTFRAVAAEVKRAPGYGDWIAFKVADLLERVMQLKVNFADCALGVYREPRAGAALLKNGDAESKVADGELEEVIAALLRSPFGRMKAPPWDDRLVNIQEAETLCCKYKSHCNGRYPIKKDLREVTHALSGWGISAERMQRRLAAYL